MTRLLKQEEIDALLSAQNNEPDSPGEEQTVASGEQQEEYIAGEGAPPAERDTAPPGGQHGGQYITAEEMDALGEIGNICMGSAATTLSILLNQKVSITSPKITISTLEELFDTFIKPHLTIHVRFTEGLSGFNLLIIRVSDANILADLMMGGEGVSASEEIDEISVSAASEAMNQMIGTASTSMATMFNRTVNISPPETKVYYNADDSGFSEYDVEGPVVVVWFNMKIGDILDTHIMQVMGFDTAREEAGLILGELIQPHDDKPALEAKEQPVEELSAGVDERSAGNFTEIEEVVQEPPAFVEPAGLYEPPAAGTMIPHPATTPSASSRAEPAAQGFDQQRLDLILDIPLKVTVLLGKTKWPIKNILGLAPGSVVELQSLVDEPVEILVNGTLVATGEVVVVNENFGVRIANIIGPRERIQNLGS